MGVDDKRSILDNLIHEEKQLLEMKMNSHIRYDMHKTQPNFFQTYANKQFFDYRQKKSVSLQKERPFEYSVDPTKSPFRDRKKEALWSNSKRALDNDSEMNTQRSLDQKQSMKNETSYTSSFQNNLALQKILLQNQVPGMEEQQNFS